MDALTPIAGKLAALIRLLSSDRDGETLAAARALGRTLNSVGADIHALADRVEQANGGLTEVEMKKLYDAGFAAGLRAAENSPTFHSVDADDDPSWSEIARVECAAYPRRMKSERERSFVDYMVRRTARNGEPTPKQADWLRKIYVRVRR
jgi:hypothetical protein